MSSIASDAISTFSLPNSTALHRPRIPNSERANLQKRLPALPPTPIDLDVTRQFEAPRIAISSDGALDLSFPIGSPSYISVLASLHEADAEFHMHMERLRNDMQELRETVIMMKRARAVNGAHLRATRHDLKVMSGRRSAEV
jgi:hypothetical protein